MLNFSKHYKDTSLKITHSIRFDEEKQKNDLRITFSEKQDAIIVSKRIVKC